MTLADLFRKVRAFFAAAGNAAIARFEALAAIAEPFAHDAVHVLQSAEKELAMSIPQNVNDAINAIKAALAGHAADNAALQQQVTDLTASNKAKDAQIADLQSQLTACQADCADLENQILALAGSASAPAPAPAPASDGSGSADVQP